MIMAHPDNRRDRVLRSNVLGLALVRHAVPRGFLRSPRITEPELRQPLRA